MGNGHGKLSITNDRNGFSLVLFLTLIYLSFTLHYIQFLTIKN